MTDHIQIGDVSPRIQYVGDGNQTAFPYPFPIFVAADLQVYLDSAVQTSGFTVTGAGSSGGGTVTFTEAPAASAIVTLRRRIAIQRTTDFQEGGAFRAKVVNDELDYQTAAIQQIADDAGRAVKRAPTSASLADLTLPEPQAGKAIGWNATADALTNDPAGFAATVATVTDQAAIAATQAGIAITQAGIATGHASTAATQAAASAASATAASASETNAAASAAAAQVAKITWTGAWSGVTAYAVHDAAEAGGTSYVCIQAHTNHQPPNAAYWDLLAAKGTDGTGIGDMLAANNLSEVTPAAARTNLGLGTAATLDVGATAGKVVQLDGSARLPAVDGSQLTGISTADAWARDAALANALDDAIAHAVVSGVMRDGTFDAFATDTIGVTSINETYDSGGKYYHNPAPTAGNLLTGGTVSASAAALPASNAVDGNTGTAWETVASNNNEWWKYDLGPGNDAAASALRLYSVGDRLNVFTLSGSTDNASWTVVVTDNYSVDNAWASYTISDANTYRYWKLDITGIPGNDVIVKEIELLARTSAANMTLLPAAATATTAPTDSRVLALYKDDSGTAVLNTDVIVDVSRDGGTTWTAVAMADAGDWDGTYRKLIGHADISAQPSGTSMKWRIRTLNTKPQRVRGVAQMWG